MGPRRGPVRIELERPIEVGDGLAQFALIFTRGSAIVPTQRETIVDLDGFGVISDSAVEVLLSVAGVGARVVSLRIAAIKRYRAIEISDGAVDIALVEPRVPAIIPGF